MLSSTQIILLGFAAFCYVLSLVFLNIKRDKWVGLLLFLSGFFVFAFASLLDDFINVWDERFHALVAKNMMSNPLKPMLYADPVLDRDYSVWYSGHVWLHKQPLFMWQMALSMKLLGKSIFAMRLPGVIMSASVVWVLYRSGTLLFNRATGFIAATLMLSSFYWMELVTGRNLLDQNDVAFISYVSLSFWALLEYHFSRIKAWLILIGVFSGGAILCKWLTGLLVYAAWGLFALSKRGRFKTEITNLLLAFGITILVAAPWQIYSYVNYPEVFKAEQEHNLSHLWQPLDHNPDATYDYYILAIQENYNLYKNWFLYVSLGLFFFIPKNSRMVRALLGAFVFQFVFFSLAVSKMPSFAMAGWFVALLAMGYSIQFIPHLLSRFHTLSRWKWPVVSLFALALIYLRIDPAAFVEKHALPENEVNHSKAMLHNKALFNSLNLEDDYVLFNVGGFHTVDAMFYLDIPVYNSYPSPGQIEELKNKKRRIAILLGEETLPDYILENEEIKKIEGFTYVYE